MENHTFWKNFKKILLHGANPLNGAALKPCTHCIVTVDIYLKDFIGVHLCRAIAPLDIAPIPL